MNPERLEDSPTALVSRTASLSYRELLERAKVVGEQSECCVGEPVALVSAGRGFDEAVALRGLLSGGATVIPLDATAPPERLASIARARGVRFVVHDEAAEKLVAAMNACLVAASEEKLGFVCLDASGELRGSSSSARRRADEIMDDRLACILHTSGSTGTPKPVPITREGLEAFTSWAADRIGLSSSDRVLRVAELIFDLSWFDHLATFQEGATLCVMSRRDLANGRAFLEAVEALRPTVIYGVPSLLMKLSAALRDKPLTHPPRVVMFAGEVFPPRELRVFAEKVPGARLFNWYGPTETNVCTFHEISRETLDGESEIPIGFACPYARCEIVDEDDPSRRIEGPGIGELVVSGVTTVGGGPYRTRDRVERKEDGLFYFRGRIDRMIKVRGYRVEPGEVEATLEGHPAVRRAAVLPHEDARLGKTLRAFVVLDVDVDVDERTLRGYLAEKLPPYMVPERIALLPELPLTTTGKIDYRKLAEG